MFKKIPSDRYHGAVLQKNSTLERRSTNFGIRTRLHAIEATRTASAFGPRSLSRIYHFDMYIILAAINSIFIILRGQAIAQQIQTSNPNLVDHLASGAQGGSGDSSSQNNGSNNDGSSKRDDYFS